ncbi:hypothetical protein C3747_102g127 [Trypanosoma cruzi]|uniref:Uncharacterized protein n=1 Tax=Trypanosoma cruzi TaxID=5693 RepID=A0A2V2WFM7_TRYCR|nr:hypothetical protein C3747_102g127 [Trypanosoma cruzi]
MGSVKEGPRVRMVARICVSLAGDVRAAMDTIVKNYEKYFIPCCVKSSQCLSWRQCLPICPTPSFFSFTAMLVRRSLQIIWMQTPWHLSPWEMPNGSSCVVLMPPRSHSTKGLNEHWCRQQELSPAFAAVVCAFPSACQNSVSCCAERTIRKKATATIASLVLPRRLY